MVVGKLVGRQVQGLGSFAAAACSPPAFLPHWERRAALAVMVFLAELWYIFHFPCSAKQQAAGGCISVGRSAVALAVLVALWVPGDLVLRNVGILFFLGCVFGMLLAMESHTPPNAYGVAGAMVAWCVLSLVLEVDWKGLAQLRVPEPEVSGEKARHFAFDNCRFVSTGLIVTCHVMSWANAYGCMYPSGVHIFTFFWPIIIPSFVFLAGFFSKSCCNVGAPAEACGPKSAGDGLQDSHESAGDDGEGTALDVSYPRRKLEGSLSTLIFPYVTFHLFRLAREVHLVSAQGSATPAQVLREELKFGSGTRTFLSGDDEAWFLLCLFVWRLTAPLWKSMQHPVVASYAAALIGHFLSGSGVVMSRVFEFLPMFVAGLTLEDRAIDALRNWKVQVASFWWLVWMWHATDPVDPIISSVMRHPEFAHTLEQPSIYTWLYTYPLQIVCVYAWLACSLGVLNFKCVISEPFALMTLYNYLLHYHPTRWLIEVLGMLNMCSAREYSPMEALRGPPLNWSDTNVIMGILSLSFTVSVVLSGRAAYLLFSVLISPRLRFLWAKDGKQPEGLLLRRLSRTPVGAWFHRAMQEEEAGPQCVAHS